jgi:MFS transporter, ACS family, DAL5 transporter family protein
MTPANLINSIVEGSATVIVAGLGAFVLPGLPSSDTHLTPEQRDLAVWRLREDFGDVHFTPSTSRLDGFRLAVCDPKTWFLCAILFFTCEL